MFAKCLLTKLPENRISMAKIANLKWMRKPIKNEFNSKDSTKFSLNSKFIPSTISLSSESNSSLHLNKLKSKSFLKITTNKIVKDEFCETEEEEGIKIKPSNYNLDPRLLNKNTKISSIKKLGLNNSPSRFGNYSVNLL